MSTYTFAWQVENVSLQVTSTNIVAGGGNVTINTAPSPGTWNNSQINLAGQYPVTVIANATFLLKGSLISITMNNVTTLAGDAHFQSCTSLQTVNLPLCQNANSFSFYNLNSLNTLNMPELTTIIGQSVFATVTGTNESLTSFNFPKLTNIQNTAGANLFQNWLAVTSITLGTQASSNLTISPSISGYTFAGFPALSTVTIPNLPTLSARMFFNTNLKSVNLAGTVQLQSILNFPQPNSIVYFGGSPPTGSGLSVSGPGTLTVYRSISATGWGSTFLGFNVSILSPATTVTPPTDSLSSTGTLTLTNTQGASIYQWYRNGVAIPGATIESYSINPATDLNTNITVQVTDILGNTATSAPNKLVKYIKGSTQVNYKFLF